MSKIPSLGAFYQCFKRPEAVISALTSFRKYYPDSDVYMVCDGGYNFLPLAQHFKCHYLYTEKIGNGQSTIPNSAEGILTWLKRLRAAAEYIKQDYVLLLEDDFVVLNKVTESLHFVINGINPAMKLGKKVTYFLKKRNKSIPFFCFNYYWGGFGGCIFDRKFILENFNNLEKDIDILLKHGNWQEYSSDIWSTLITLYNGGTIGQYKGLCETWHKDYLFRRNTLNDIAVLHQYKEVYNKPLSQEDLEKLGNYQNSTL